MGTKHLTFSQKTEEYLLFFSVPRSTLLAHSTYQPVPLPALLPCHRCLCWLHRHLAPTCFICSHCDPDALNFFPGKPRIYNRIVISHPRRAIFLSFCPSLLYFSPMCYRCIWLFFSVQMCRPSSVCSCPMADLCAPGIPFYLPQCPLISFLHCMRLPISSLWELTPL